MRVVAFTALALALSAWDAAAAEVDIRSQACPRTLASTAAPPEYPRAAYVYKIQGRVRAVLDVDASGAVLATRVERAEPTKKFDKAVAEALSGWRFPARDAAWSCWHDLVFQLEGDRSPPLLAFGDEGRLRAELVQDPSALAARFAALRSRCQPTKPDWDVRNVDASRIPRELPSDVAEALLALRRVSGCALATPEQLSEPAMVDHAIFFWSRGLGEGAEAALMLDGWRHRDARAPDAVEQMMARQSLLRRFHTAERSRLFPEVDERSARLWFISEDAMKDARVAYRRLRDDGVDKAVEFLKDRARRYGPSASRAMLVMQEANILAEAGRLDEAGTTIATATEDATNPKPFRLDAFVWRLELAVMRRDATAWQQAFDALVAAQLLSAALTKI